MTFIKPEDFQMSICRWGETGPNGTEESGAYVVRINPDGFYTCVGCKGNLLYDKMVEHLTIEHAKLYSKPVPQWVLDRLADDFDLYWKREALIASQLCPQDCIGAEIYTKRQLPEGGSMS
jgi:hypothetical protein